MKHNHFQSSLFIKKFITPAILFSLCLQFQPLFAAGSTDQKEQQYSSVEERRLAQSIQSERASLLEEKKELALRKKELKSLEEGVDKKLAEIDTKLEELKSLRKQLEKLFEQKSEEELRKRQDLAKIYEKMTPGKAALALTGLDQQLAAELLANMKVKAAAKILDAINRQKASELSTTFSTIQLE